MIFKLFDDIPTIPLEQTVEEAPHSICLNDDNKSMISKRKVHWPWT